MLFRSLPSRPTKVAVNTIQHLVYAVLPERNMTAILDPDQPTPIIATANTPQATDLIVSDDGSTIYVSHLTGELSAIDARTGQLLSRVEISPPGLFAITQAQGLISAINVPQKQLIVVDPQSWQVTQRVALDQLPAALIAGPLTGSVYVLEVTDPVNASGAPQPPVLFNYDPQTGASNGSLLLSNLTGQMGQSAVGNTGDDPGLMALSNGMAVNPFAEIVYLVNPSAGQISVAAPCLFPTLSQTAVGKQIPRADWLCPGGQ